MTTPVQRLIRLLNIRYPVIQAPMAGGITTPDLVASASEAGGLGSFGASYMSPGELRQAIRAVRQKTSASYQVNLFVPDRNADYKPDRHADALNRLSRICGAYGVEFSGVVPPAKNDFAEQIQVVMEERTPVVSFTFGIPDDEVLTKLRQARSVIMGTATCVAEAQDLAHAGFDVIVAQGFEAGGHRATFHSTLDASGDIPNVGLFALLPQMVTSVPVPVVASGGIMNGAGIVAAIALGAAGCQLGTAFMGCPEAKLTPGWRDALSCSADTGTALTRVFSGRFARGIRNRFMAEMEPVIDSLPPFPIQNTLTGPLRTEAKRRDDTGYQSLWAGQAARLARRLPADELLGTLMHEVETASRHIAGSVRPFKQTLKKKEPV